MHHPGLGNIFESTRVRFCRAHRQRGHYASSVRRFGFRRGAQIAMRLSAVRARMRRELIWGETSTKFYTMTIALLCLCGTAFADETSKKAESAEGAQTAPSAPSAASAEGNTATLTLVVTGMKTDKGNLRIILARTERELDTKDEPFRRHEAPVKDGKSKIVFEDVPMGECAIKLFHDVNGNEKLDRNVLGIPKEPYGFSNNARGKMGPPKYDRVKFQLDKDPMKIEIKAQ